MNTSHLYLSTSLNSIKLINTRLKVSFHAAIPSGRGLLELHITIVGWLASLKYNNFHRSVYLCTVQLSRLRLGSVDRTRPLPSDRLFEFEFWAEWMVATVICTHPTCRAVDTLQNRQYFYEFHLIQSNKNIYIIGTV